MQRSTAYLFLFVYFINTSEGSYPFKQYSLKGIHECTTQYIGEIIRLHRLMREIYNNYTECEKQVANVREGYMGATGLEPFDQLVQKFRVQDVRESG